MNRRDDLCWLPRWLGWWGFSDNIDIKPVPRRPYRASYRAQVRDARRRRNVAKRGGAR